MYSKRDNDNLVFFAVKELIKEKVAGLAIKSIYYTDLPQYIKDYANEQKFPIFIFHSIFIENLIRTISSSLQSRLFHEVFEAKLEAIFKGMLSKHLVKQLAYELNSNFLDFQQVIYCKEKIYVSDNNIFDLIERYLRNKTHSKHHGVYKFRTGIIIIMTFKTNINSQIDIDFNHLLAQIGLDKEDYIIGKSQTNHSLENINIPIKESYYAYKTAEITNKNMQDYSLIGIYRLLIPLMNDPWATRYSKSIIEPILNYDSQFDAHLYETIELYFRLGCNTKLTSEKLFQHRNTILYRLKKVKELVGPFINEQDFTEQLSIALKIHESIYQSSEYST
jgi:sugar diacid utilization regulator